MLRKLALPSDLNEKVNANDFGCVILEQTLD